MKNKILLCLSISFLINTVCLAQWVSLDKNSLQDAKPTVQLISDDITGTVIKVELPGFKINKFIAGGKTYHSINIGPEATTTEVGLPEIPYLAKVLAIPDQGSISVEVLETC